MSGEGTAQEPQARPPASSGMSWMFIFLFMILIFMSPGPRTLIGNAISVVLNPLIAFGGTAPIWSLFFGTLIIAVIANSVRTFLTDWIALARNQNYMKAFNKELSEARKNQNQQRMQKLMELQPQMMNVQMEIQGQTMKPTVFTFILFIAFITWVYSFISIAAVNVIATPWNPSVALVAGGLFSSGLLVYILFTIPISQIVVNIWKYIRFSKRLAVIKAGDEMEVAL